MNEVKLIQKIVGFILIIGSILLFIVLKGCGDGYSITTSNIEEECTIEDAYDIVMSFCSSVCVEKNNKKQCVLKATLLHNGNIQCKCKPCKDDDNRIIL
jgi:hypothetical protein